MLAGKPDYKINYSKVGDSAKWREVAQPVYDSFIEETSKEWATAIETVAKGGYTDWKVQN